MGYDMNFKYTYHIHIKQRFSIYTYIENIKNIINI